MASGETVRIGILCDGPHLAAWQAECVRKVQELGFAEIVALIVNAREPAASRPLSVRFFKALSSGLLAWRVYERLVLNRKSQALKTTPLSEALANVPQIAALPIRIGKFREALDAETIEAIKQLDIDILLRFGFGILTGEILSIPRYGTWSFHHGDPTVFRGAPPGFWEIRHGDPVTGVVLQRLTEALDGGVVLHSGWFKTDAASYPRSLDHILFGAAHFVARALVDLHRNPQPLLNSGALEKPGPVYRYPRNGAMLAFLTQSFAAWCKDQFRSLFRHQQWTLGIVEQSASNLFKQAADGMTELREAKWLPEVKGGFLADPFAMTDTSGETRLFAEEFDWAADQGHIAAVVWSERRPVRTTAVIRNGMHLSYPYTFEEGGQLYCVPECAESRAVLIYRWDAERQSWNEHAPIVDDFPALDPTVFKHEGRWWMLCTNAESGGNEMLYAWHSTDLLGPWSPHSANPLKVDIRTARPAGRPFLHEGRLIRPAQDCSTHYGAAIAFNRVVTLTPDEFVEEPAGRLAPNRSGRYRAGLHTFGAMGDLTIVDGARWAFVAAQMKRALSRKLGRSRV